MIVKSKSQSVSQDRQIVHAYQKGDAISAIEKRFGISERTLYRTLKRQNVTPNRRLGVISLAIDEGIISRISNRLEEIYSILTTTTQTSSKNFHDENQRKRILSRYNKGEILRHIAEGENVHGSYIDRTLARFGVKRNRYSKKAA